MTLHTQSDQIARFYVQYSAILNNEDLDNNNVFCQGRFKMLPNTKLAI